MLKNILLAIVVFLTGSSSSFGDLMITQYYEGTSNNKWLEIKNTGSTAYNLSTVSIGLWNNANAEGYKTNVAPSSSTALSGTLATNGVFLVRHSSATLPSYAVSNLATTSVMSFNGNDSIAIYAGTFSTASIIDAIGFTNLGTEGLDRSFVRLTNGTGWNTTSGSNATSFATVWGQATLAVVNDVLVSGDNRIGVSSITAVPEPTSVVLVGLIGVAGVVVRTRRRLAEKA